MLIVPFVISMLLIVNLSHDEVAYGRTSLSDIDSSYAKNEIERLVDAGIISGFEDGAFAPAKPMTRGELSKVLTILLGLHEKPEAAGDFDDVAEGSWYRGYIGALVDSGITQGTSASKFSPDAFVTREELAVFFIRAFDLEKDAQRFKAVTEFTDAEHISEWAKPYVSLAFRIGFIGGMTNADGSLRFEPHLFAERQAAARLAYEFMENKNNYLERASKETKGEKGPEPTLTPTASTSTATPASTPAATPTSTSTPTPTSTSTPTPTPTPTMEPTATPTPPTQNETAIIVQNGQANAAIIVDADAESQILKAANTLADYVKKSTGATLPIMNAADFAAMNPTDDLVRIYMDPTDSFQDEHIDSLMQGLNSDGFIIHMHENTIVIAGPSVWGTQNGVFDFLERYVGVRWLMPGEDGEEVPETSSLRIPREDVVEQPAFKFRMISPLVVKPDEGGRLPLQYEWAQRNRVQGDYNAPLDLMHNLHILFSPEKYGVTHPEYYPNNTPPAPNVTTGWQPCFSAVGTVQAASESIIQYFNENPNKTSYSLSVNDVGGFCEANPAHPSFPNKYNSIGLLDMSDIYYNWVNQVVAEVLTVHPDKWFGLLAYQEVMDPPSFSLNSRVIPFITKDRMAWIDDETKEQGQSQMEQWNAVANELGWYDYTYGTFYVVPRMYQHQMAENYQYAYEHQVSSIYMEMYSNWGDGPKPWVTSKLLWNPNLNIDDLLDEWYLGAVGETAAADLKSYYALWEQIWTERMKTSEWFHVAKGRTFMPFQDLSYLHEVTDEDIAESRRLLESVVDKAVTNKQKARANLLLQAFEYYEASALSYARENTKPSNVSEAIALLDHVGNTIDSKMQLAQKRYDLLEQFKENPVLIDILPPYYWSGWNKFDFWNLVEYMKGEAEGGEFTQKVNELAANVNPSQSREFARLLKEATTGEYPLIPNFSFEDGAATTPPWSYWVQTTGKMERAEGIAHTGNASLKVSGLDEGGPVMLLSVKPGPTAFRAYYFTPPETVSDGSIQLAFIMQDAQGRALGEVRSEQKSIAATSGSWSSIELLEDIPVSLKGSEVKQILVIVIVNDITDGTNLYIDDVMMYQNAAVISDQKFWRMTDLAANEGPNGGPVRNQITELAGAAEPSDVREYARLMLNILAGAAPVTENASFETGTTTDVSPWSLGWIEGRGAMERRTGTARSGNAGLLIKGLLNGGPFQNVSPKAGPFALRAYFHAPGATPTTAGTIQLAVNLKDASGNELGNIMRSNFKPISVAANGWITVDMAGIIPEKINGIEVSTALVVVVVSNMEEETELYLDDVDFYQLSSSSPQLQVTDQTFWSLLDEVAANESNGGPIRNQITELANGTEPSEGREYARLLLSVVDGAASVMENASFETGTVTDVSPWSLGWIEERGVMEHHEGTAHSGNAGLLIKGLYTGGPFQMISPKAGPYAMRAHFRVPAGTPTTAGTIQLAINLKDASGNELGILRSNLMPVSGGADGWAAIELAGIIPEQINGIAVSAALVVAIVSNLEEQTELYLDDVGFYQLP
ncbi:DUF4838 domain-containing protein [Paenibacillus contaminans]|uniref:DUF4838 domain-containing protein n=1 Tax=Paenibacillus contaminans TaxID=450362 RepID=UPI0013147C94|nr:DUF4838 domain-containing protein [Paenibacillus contaminans]